ncbi:MAG TPA: UbiA family prenyltransferase [Pirellulales bacterium]|nr:UbiA family prenyltransferase [Pirellulales bacterium]
MSNVLPADETVAQRSIATAEVSILFVDLDGSLVASNTLIELFLSAVRYDPRSAFRASLWLFRGRLAFKSHLANLTSLDAAALPYRAEVLTLLTELKREGCRLVLATASPYAVARQVAQHVGLFDDVLASDERRNLKGSIKLAAIEEYCCQHGYQNFAYLGDSWADVPIWQRAVKVLVVAPSAQLSRRVARLQRPVTTLQARQGSWKACLRAVRAHQWMKNILMFLPLLFAHAFQYADYWKWMCALVAFVAFSACASSVYLVNDLLDLEEDRRHPRKRNRPFASGQLPLEFGLLVAPLLALFGLGLSLFTVGSRFPLMLLLYLVCSGLYCLWLKRVALVDVFLLSGLYMLRLQAGGTASAVPVSEWLLIFCLFFFLSLAFAKRFVEIDHLELANDKHVTGRGYRTIDAPTLSSMGATSGYVAVLVLALYFNSHEVRLLYARPKVLYILCPTVLFWISRLWMLARRNELHDDPVIFALKDRVSQLLGGLSAATILLAWLLQ